MPPHPSVPLHHLLATGSTGSSGNSAVSTVVLVAIFGAVIYFILIRPQRNRSRAAQQTAATLEPGVEVLTRHGQFATVVAVDDDGLTLEIAPGVQSRFVREAIARVITPEEPEPEDEPPYDAEPSNPELDAQIAPFESDFAEPAAGDTPGTTAPPVEPGATAPHDDAPRDDA